MAKPSDKPDKPEKPEKVQPVFIDGSLHLTGIPPLPDDIKIHIPRDVTVHHVFDTPLHVVLEMAPETLKRISLTLSTP